MQLWKMERRVPADMGEEPKQGFVFQRQAVLGLGVKTRIGSDLGGNLGRLYAWLSLAGVDIGHIS